MVKKHNNILIGPKGAINVDNRGATELMSRFFKYDENYKVHYIDEINIIDVVRWIYLDSSFKLIGVSYYGILKIILVKYLMFFSRGRIDIYRTATYSRNLRLLAERILGLATCPSNDISILCLHERVSGLYCDAKIYNIIPALKSDLTRNKNLNTCKEGSTKYNFGYIGRVCAEKGFYSAVKALNRLDFLGFSCTVNILAWTEKDKKICENLLNDSVNKVIKNKVDTKEPPFYNDIDILILPYKSLTSTVQVPFVVLEAIISGCIVITSNDIKNVVNPLLGALSHRLYSYNNESEIIGLCKKCIKELKQQV